MGVRVDMGINRRSENNGNAKVAMHMEEFKAWVRTNIDADQDGKISRYELADFMRRKGEPFAGLRVRKWIRSAGSNRNGVVDEIQIGNLAEFAQKHLGIMIIPSSYFENYDINELITEAGRLSAPSKSEAESMFLTEEQLKEVFKRFEAIEEPVLRRVDLKKAFNHFGLFFPHHAANVFDAKKEGCVKLTELDDLVNSAARLGYTVN